MNMKENTLKSDVYSYKLSAGIVILQGTVSVICLSTSYWFQLNMIFILTFTFSVLVWIFIIHGYHVFQFFRR